LRKNVLVGGKSEFLFLLLRVVVAHVSVGGVLSSRSVEKGKDLWIGLLGKAPDMQSSGIFIAQDNNNGISCLVFE
jgi:hypothetical protein